MSNDSESDSTWRMPLGWLATGFERQGAVTRKGSTPSSSLLKKTIRLLDRLSCFFLHNWESTPVCYVMVCLRCENEYYIGP